MIHSYSSVYALGHKALGDILDGPVVVQEKIDGSQFSFGIVDFALEFRSKGTRIYAESCPKMFERAVATVLNIAELLPPGWIYRAEVLDKPKHNVLAYERVPAGNLILFDVMIGEEQYLAPGEMGAEAVRLGLECVPTYFNCDASEIHMDHLKALLTHTSILGGPIEGIVVKNYNLFTQEKKIAIAKLVREEFKETHKKEWKISNPTKKDVIEQLVAELATPARWAKAVQHLRDEGKLVNAPQDIGPLMKEIPADILKEEGEYIKQKLFCVFWEEIKRGVTRGFPDWYKQKLTSEVLSPQIEENERE